MADIEAMEVIEATMVDSMARDLLMLALMLMLIIEAMAMEVIEATMGDTMARDLLML